MCLSNRHNPPGWRGLTYMEEITLGGCGQPLLSLQNPLPQPCTKPCLGPRPRRAATGIRPSSPGWLRQAADLAAGRRYDLVVHVVHCQHLRGRHHAGALQHKQHLSVPAHPWTLVQLDTCPGAAHVQHNRLPGKGRSP